jgi:hypothetical protein
MTSMNCSLRAITVAALLFGVACSDSSADKQADAAAQAAATADSLASAAKAEADKLRNDARSVLAELLSDPSSATFDSLVVVRPSAPEGHVAIMSACGRISGKPGSGGSRTPTRFVYQGRFTVFVEDGRNGDEFAALWAMVCDAPGATIFPE